VIRFLLNGKAADFGALPGIVAALQHRSFNLLFWFGRSGKEGMVSDLFLGWFRMGPGELSGA